MSLKHSNPAVSSGRDIAPGVPAQKGSVMEDIEDVRVASDRALVSDQAATRLDPSGFDPSRGILHLRNGRADRHPQTYGEGITWCGKKLLGKPDCSTDRVEVFTSYGSEVHVTAFDPGLATCQRCRDAFDIAYNAAFPDGLKPLATIRFDDPHAKELLSPDTMTRFFGPNGEGGSAYERFVASIGRGGSDAGCSMGVGCDEYGVCYADAHGRPEMCPRDSDGSPEGGDGLPGSVHDSAGPQDIAQGPAA